MSQKNKWDLLSTLFDTHQTRINPSVADNIVIAWPAILKHLKKKGGRVADYGCGAGSFCSQLNARGYRVIGIDSSEKLIEIARKFA